MPEPAQFIGSHPLDVVERRLNTLRYYLLPTMAYEMHYDEEVYVNFWEQCRDDVDRFRSQPLS